jgi:hypothetical protein
VDPEEQMVAGTPERSDEPATAGDSFDDVLVSQLTVIEGQPLEARAAAYTQMHDQLRARLEGGDVPRSPG